MADGREVGIASVAALIRARSARARFFPKGLFADPAWDILLDLYQARISGKQISVSSACLAAAVPVTTALRYIRQLQQNGLIERHYDPGDARRVFVRLSPKAMTAMSGWMRTTHLAPLGLS